jgi:hypothetical protein
VGTSNEDIYVKLANFRGEAQVREEGRNHTHVERHEDDQENVSRLVIPCCMKCAPYLKSAEIYGTLLLRSIFLVVGHGTNTSKRSVWP